METRHKTELLKILWPLQGGQSLVCDDGRTAVIESTGEYDEESGLFLGARVVLEGTSHYGSVVALAGEASREMRYDSCILHVAGQGSGIILRQDGFPLPRTVLTIPAVVEETYRMLITGAERQGCARNLAAMDSFDRASMLTRLAIERFERKSAEVLEFYEEKDQSWHETLFLLLLRTMGDSANKLAFTELARRVKYSIIARERTNLRYVEALLLGSSGFLEMYADDSYIRELKSDFKYLQNKYSIEPMMPSVWNLTKVNPYNHPVIRLAQLAAFLCTNDFLFDNVIKCRAVDDLHRLFRAEASEYWSTHFIPSQYSEARPKRIGHEKANVLGINMVVPIMLAYSRQMNDEELWSAAMDYLDKIPRENNYITHAWTAGGTLLENAHDSQAVIELNNEYCRKGMCRRCRIGKRTIDKVYREHCVQPRRQVPDNDDKNTTTWI